MVSETGPQKPGRIVVKTLWIIVGVIGGILIFALCQDVFAGYPQYGTDIMTYIGLTIVMAIAAYAWLIDHRRLDAGEFDARRPDAGRPDADD
jgi:hypothetical protein